MAEFFDAGQSRRRVVNVRRHDQPSAFGGLRRPRLPLTAKFIASLPVSSPMVGLVRRVVCVPGRLFSKRARLAPVGYPASLVAGDGLMLHPEPRVLPSEGGIEPMVFSL